MSPRRKTRVVRLLGRTLAVLSISMGAAATTAFAQSAATWSGQVQCQLDDQDQYYSRHEVQTWMITGANPTIQGAMHLYPASWSATGQGALQRTQGEQIRNLQWTTNVPATQATIVVFVRASDNRLIIKPWHSQMSVDNAVIGTRQVFVNGVAQQPSGFSHTAWEWQFPRIEDFPTNSSVSGSSQSQADAGDAELLHHYGGMPPSARCQWQFTKGGAAPSNSNQFGMNGAPSNQNPQGSMAGDTDSQNNGQNCDSPASVQQSFENMKSNLQTQFNQLIQGTSDPGQVASLTSQEQRLLTNLNTQEQHDMAAASQGCVQVTSNQGSTPYSGGSPNAGAANAGGAAAGGSAGAAGGMNAGSPNAGGGAANAGGGAAAGSASAAGGMNVGSPNAGGAANAGTNPGAGGSPSGSNGSSGLTSTPQLVSLSPSGVSQGSTSTLHLIGQGTHWQNQTSVSFGPQITVQSFTADPSGTSAVATINVAGTASLGARPVMLMSGTEMVGLPSGLTVTPSAAQQGNSGSTGSPMRVETGSGFSGSSVLLAGMLVGASPATNNGQQNVTVTLTGKYTNFANGGTKVSFVRSSQPGSTALTVKVPSVATTLNNISSAPPSLQVGPANVVSKTTASVPLTIDPTAAAGTYSITVSTPTANGTETVSLNNAFTVTTTPAIHGVNLNPGTGIVKKTGSTPASAAPASATYRVTITGLMCLRAITGGGDAIYGAAVVRQYDRRSGQGTMSTNMNTWVYGDVNGMINQRKQAGSRGPTGGIGAGDLVPPGFIPGPKDSLPPQPNLFPMAVWQGTLTDGVDVLVISPSLWISYGDNSMFSTWNQNEDSLTNSIFLDSKVQNQISTQTLGTLSLGPSENISGSAAQTLAGDATLAAVETSIQAAGLTFGIPVGVFASAGPTHDRPIGVASASSDPTSSTILPNATLVLTREMIEKRLGSNAWTTTFFDFRDSPASFSSFPGSDRPGEYQMFIQIERQ